MNKNKIITLLGLFAMSMMVMAQGSEKLVSNQILNQKVVDEGDSGMFNAVALEEKDDKGRDEKANNFNPSLIPYNYFQLFLVVFIGLTTCFSAMAS